MDVYIYMYIYMHTHIYTYICTYVYIFIIYICTYMRVYSYIYIYIYIYVYIYIYRGGVLAPAGRTDIQQSVTTLGWPQPLTLCVALLCAQIFINTKHTDIYMYMYTYVRVNLFMYLLCIYRSPEPWDNPSKFDLSNKPWAVLSFAFRSSSTPSTTRSLTTNFKPNS